MYECGDCCRSRKTDHIYLCVSILPNVSVSNLMGCLTGKSTLIMNDM